MLQSCAVGSGTKVFYARVITESLNFMQFVALVAVKFLIEFNERNIKVSFESHINIFGI